MSRTTPSVVQACKILLIRYKKFWDKAGSQWQYQNYLNNKRKGPGGKYTGGYREDKDKNKTGETKVDF